MADTKRTVASTLATFKRPLPQRSDTDAGGRNDDALFVSTLYELGRIPSLDSMRRLTLGDVLQLGFTEEQFYWLCRELVYFLDKAADPEEFYSGRGFLKHIERRESAAEAARRLNETKLAAKVGPERAFITACAVIVVWCCIIKFAIPILVPFVNEVAVLAFEHYAKGELFSAVYYTIWGQMAICPLVLVAKASCDLAVARFW
jgi:hypothetical protein